MGNHPRIECKKVSTFQTTRTRRSELWFVDNPALDQAILGYAAKYTERYGVKLYALAIEGNHIQFPALFPLGNRAHFMRDFNSSIARAVPRLQVNHPGGGLWARRYSAEYLPGDEDIEDQFFYTVLQSVQDGLVDSISDYPGCNCFEDAIRGISRSYKVVRWKEYNDARRWDPNVAIEKFTDMYELRYERLPGYTNISQAAYARVMRNKLRVRTEQILKDRGYKPSAGPQYLKAMRPGTRPHSTKSSTLRSHRPRILSKDNRRRALGKAWYFSLYSEYRRASRAYRSGERGYKFPDGTYKPPAFTVVKSGSIN